MPRTLPPALLTVPLEPSASVPLYRQLYDGVRDLILRGDLPAGTRLPSTRTLAGELRVSRNTIATAFEQLWAEGYVQGKWGSGTYVSDVLPEHALSPSSGPSVTAQSGKRLPISARGRVLAATPVSTTPRLSPVQPFQIGVPACEAFPGELWGRLLARRWRERSRALMAYADPAGYGPLREAIAAYLAAGRGVRCEPEQVIMVAGSQQGLDLAAQVLLDPGDVVCLEDPGYIGARAAFQGAGAQLRPTPLDEEGLDVTQASKHESPPRLVYVTPSRQFPLGMTMSLARRLALLDWAAATGAWIVEDDYDSEYRYASRPLAALQGLDRDGRVIYLGTFSKVLFPSLRLGYLVVPPDLVDAFVAARALSDRHSPVLDQVVLTDFIRDGHFARHLRRMRTLYADRQATLLKAAQRELAGLLDVQAADAGMHVIGWLPPGVDDRRASREAAREGVTTAPLSAYRLKSRGRPALLLGYAAYSAREIRDGIRMLARALQPSMGTHSA